MTSKQIGLYLLEKAVLVICACMLLLQIFLSIKNFQRKDYVETQEEDHLFNADMPMIVLCAKTPFTPQLSEFFYIGLDLDADQEEGSFVGWTVENISTHNNLKSKATAHNISDLLKIVWVANDSWSATDGSIQLTKHFKPMRITFNEGQCFSLVVPKEEVRMHIVGSNRFIMALGFEEDVRVKVYLYDPNTYNGYFNPAKAIAFDNNGTFQMFDVALEQILQSPDDPKVDCQSYTATNGYYNCAKQKFEEIFIRLINCVPPWFTDDQAKVCQYEDSQVTKPFATREGYGDQMLGKAVFLTLQKRRNVKLSNIFQRLFSTATTPSAQNPARA